MRYKDCTKVAIRDIKGKEFVSGTYSICTVVYAAVQLRWLCDKNDPVMDKLQHGTRRTSEALEGTRNQLLYHDVFPVAGDDGDLAFELGQVNKENTEGYEVCTTAARTRI